MAREMIGTDNANLRVSIVFKEYRGTVGLQGLADCVGFSLVLPDVFPGFRVYRHQEGIEGRAAFNFVASHDGDIEGAIVIEGACAVTEEQRECPVLGFEIA